MSGASAERLTVIAKYFWPLSSTMLPDKKALDVVGVIGSRPSAYLIRLGIPSPAGLAPFSPAPTFEGLPKWLSRQACSGVSDDLSSRPNTPTQKWTPNFGQ